MEAAAGGRRPTNHCSRAAEDRRVVVVAGVFSVIRKVVYRLNNNNVGELEVDGVLTSTID